LRKALLIGQGQADNFGLLDGALRGVLDGDDYEVGHGAPLKLSGAFEHRMQIGTDPGFEASGRNSCSHSDFLFLEIYGNLPYKATTMLPSHAADVLMIYER
jgi:hypothetical protein